MGNSDSHKVMQRLYEITAHDERGFPSQARELLDLGCQRFGVEIGILSHVVGNRYHVVHQVSPESIPLQDGAEFDLPITYCSITMNADKPVGFSHVSRSEIYNHPAYENFALEAYIGVPIRIDGQTYGTLNFSSPYPRKRKFSKSDILALELMAAWVERQLSNSPGSQLKSAGID